MIPYARQQVIQADIDAVVEALKADFITQGPLIPRFEQAVAARTGCRHAVAFNSATSALHAASLALGLCAGERLWTVPNTFVASANCARYCGADVDFVDIDPATWNMSSVELEDRLVRARRDNRLPRIVVPVHFAGQPTEQERIHALAGQYGFKVVEDASHSLGARRYGEPVGSCRWSDITVLSFHPVKIITSGEGGMALTNDAGLAASLAMIRSHGVTRDPRRFQGPAAPGADPHEPEPWYYEQQLLGFNYRLTDIHAALGLSQLTRLEEFVARRNQLASRYQDLLQGLPLKLPTVQAGNHSAFHLYVVRVDRGDGGRFRRQVFNALRQRGIGVNVHYLPVHLQPYYRTLGFADGQFPESEAHGAGALTLPLYPDLTNVQQDEVVTALRQVLAHG
jgi:UDP-4-amino-4,6-dideoxy-N-acetyl-beta-L-altrosamine transaminase